MSTVWWKKANFYQIWPKSFFDSNSDGIGDIPGIIQKLDYIKNLGFDAIWITPFYKSPMIDNGYDVADYFEVNEQFGTNSDIENLIKLCKDREMKVIIDVVFNHTSDQHHWFKESCRKEKNKYSDYYIWRDEPDYEIASSFGGKAWDYNEKRGQYYFHLFTKEQPDLNWENPVIADECANILRKWVEKGVGGFRLDVIDLIGKEIDKRILANGPKVHEMIKKIMTKAGMTEEIFRVGECWGASSNGAVRYTHPDNGQLSAVFAFQHVGALNDKQFEKYKYHRTTPEVIEKMLVTYSMEIKEKGGWVAPVFENHDIARCIDIFGSVKYPKQSAKTIGLLQYSIPGTPFCYQGQEIGMRNFRGTKMTDFVDVEALQWYNQWVEIDKVISEQDFINGVNMLGRDNARRPVIWQNNEKYGFTTGKPWIKSNFVEVESVEFQLKEENSILAFYKTLNNLRKGEYSDFFIDGNISNVGFASDKRVISFWNTYKNETIKLIFNFSDEIVEIDVKKPEFLVNTENSMVDNETLYLKPWSSVIWK